MPSARPNWPDLLDPSFREVYVQTEANFPSRIGQIFTIENSTKATEKETSASGLSRLVLKGEGDAIKYEDPTQGYDVTYSHLTRGLGSSITMEMWEDDQYGVMKMRPRQLALAKARTMEQFAADIFNHGFTAGGGGIATFQSGDGQALFSTAHPRTDGGTPQSNMITADLAEDSLEQALTMMRATVDDKGQLASVMPDTLLVPPALEKEARILLESQGRTGTANNDINPYRGSLNLIVWDWLGAAAGGSDTAWFLLDSNGNRLKWFNRTNRGVEGPEWDFDTETAKWKVIVRNSVGFSDWRGVFASKGDNS